MALAVPLVALALVWWSLRYMQNQNAINQYAFTLQSVDGVVKMSDFKGKKPIVYFGYMYCPDICPTTLSLLSSALHKLPKEQAEQFQIIFISVDPQRDALKELKEYANYFDKNAIGLSGDENYLKKITDNYGTYYAKEYLEGSNLEYSVNHTTFVYFFDQNGKLKDKIQHVNNTEAILEVLQKML